MVFGKHINRYYIKYLLPILLGIAALIAVDYFQLIIPEIYRIVVNGINDGAVEIDGVMVNFDKTVLWNEVCKPMFIVIAVMIVGRFLWRICLFGSGYRLEKDLRGRMFSHAKDMSI